MRQRRIGADSVSSIGLGCMGMSEFYGSADRKESIRVIHRALEIGVSLLDTSDMYGSGANEELISEALADRRDLAFIATKFGVLRGPGGSFEGVSGRPEYVGVAAEASLRRLGVDTIDLYYQHRVDPTTPIEETVGAMARLVEEGKVRYLGLSEAAPATLRRAHAVHPIAALQTEYSLWSREPETELLDVCVELGITFVAYSPLGRGFLSGRIRSPEDLDETDFRRNHPRFYGENLAKNLRLVDQLRELADTRGLTMAQLALAWVLSKDPCVVPIPGTTRVDRLEENVAAVEIALTRAEMERIEEVLPVGATAGTRYPERAMRMVNL